MKISSFRLPPSSFRLLVLLGLIALCFALFFQTLSVQADTGTHTAPDDDAPYDLSIDLNGDGVPDQLAEALDELDALAAQQADDPAVAAQYNEAMARFTRRLPYAPETRARQQAMWTLFEKMMASEDTDEALAIMAEMDVLRAEIALDPNFAIVDRVLRQRFVDGLAENDAVAVEDAQAHVDPVVVFQGLDVFQGTNAEWQSSIPATMIAKFVRRLILRQPIFALWD